VPITADDRFEIQDLYARYSRAVDANNGALWIDCWTPDGEFVPAVGPTAGTPYRGHQAISDFGNVRPDNYTRARIWTGNYLLEDRGDYVEGTCYGLVVTVDGPAPELSAAIVYHDEIVRHEGKWKFRARRPRLDVERDRGQG